MRHGTPGGSVEKVEQYLALQVQGSTHNQEGEANNLVYSSRFQTWQGLTNSKQNLHDGPRRLKGGEKKIAFNRHTKFIPNLENEWDRTCTTGAEDLKKKIAFKCRTNFISNLENEWDEKKCFQPLHWFCTEFRQHFLSLQCQDGSKQTDPDALLLGVKHAVRLGGAMCRALAQEWKENELLKCLLHTPLLPPPPLWHDTKFYPRSEGKKSPSFCIAWKRWSCPFWLADADDIQTSEACWAMTKALSTVHGDTKTQRHTGRKDTGRSATWLVHKDGTQLFRKDFFSNFGCMTPSPHVAVSIHTRKRYLPSNPSLPRKIFSPISCKR